MQRNILIVEDEDILREIVKDYLLHDGYEVHLIILDIMLPKLDG